MIRARQQGAPAIVLEVNLDVNRFANYLQSHHRLRLIALSAGFAVASVALYTGAGVYVLTLGPKAVGDYIRDRFLAVGLIALALLVNTGTAWVLAQRGGGFASRLALSLLATVGGSILVFGLIIARVFLVKNLGVH
jgi:hypothetical protein